MAILYFDCFSGAAGDMILGALIDAGVPLGDVRRALGSLAVDPEAIWTERVTRAGIAATKFHVRGEGGAEAVPHHQHHQHSHTHSHSHSHGSAAVHDHAHRTLEDVQALVETSALSPAAKRRAKELFARLAEAEAAVHGTPVEKVHLHEVGALDSVVDIVGSVFALEALGVRHISASPLNVGSGMVRTGHGLYPIPAPATAMLLRGAPIYSGPQETELVTPTGALLVTAYAESFGPVPPMRLTRVGYGAGSRDFRDTPNVLRVLIGEAGSTAHTVAVIETEIDDMNPQIFGVLIDRLMAEGALDVYYTPIQMKKSRPGTLLTIVAPPAAREALTAVVFRETTTIGVRYSEMSRECLDRETVTVQTPFGQIPVKVARRGGEILNASPEFEACARLAAEQRRPVKDVHAAAMKAFLDTR